VPIFKAHFSTVMFNFIQWVSIRPLYLQVGPDPEKFGNHWYRRELYKGSQ